MQKEFIMNQELQKNSLVTLRNALFNSIMDVRNGNMDSKDAMSIAKLSNSVIETYKTEIETVRTIDSLKDRNVSYANAIGAVHNEATLVENNGS